MERGRARVLGFLRWDAASGMPERIGSYELLVPLGSGGMASVYLARRLGVDGVERSFALKLTHPHLRSQPARAQELIKEARIAARIRHRNVTRVFDVDDDVAGVFLVMEYVEGDSLAGLQRALDGETRKMPLAIALGIVTQALDGLHAAHETTNEAGEPLALVHRDVSPHNILVGVDGTARLTDFGIAKLKDGGQLTESGVVKGKFGYMAPEQVRGRELDRRVDVWAAGVVAWELATGQRLLDDGDQASAMLRLVTERPQRARSVNPELSEALDDAIAGALELDPKRRWPTAAAFAAQLRGAVRPADESTIAMFVRNVVGDALALRARAADVRRPAAAELTARTSRRRARSAAVLGTIAVASALLAGLAVAARAGRDGRARASVGAPANDLPPATFAVAAESANAVVAIAPPSSATAIAPSATVASAVAPQVLRAGSPAPPVLRAPHPARPAAPAAKPAGPARAPSLLDNPYRNE